MLKKKIAAAVVAGSIAVGGVTTVDQVAVAQSMTMAEIYQPQFGATAADLSTTRTLIGGTVENGANRSDIVSIEVIESTSPYPMELEIQYPFPNHPLFYGRLMNERIYPSKFEVSLKARCTYKDGSSEIIDGKVTVYPTKGLVKEETKPAPSGNDDKGSSAGAIIGVVVGVLALLGLIGAGAVAAGLIPGVSLPF